MLWVSSLMLLLVLSWTSWSFSCLSHREQRLGWDQWEAPARHWAEKSVFKELPGSCWVWAQQLIGDEVAPAEHLPVWWGSSLKYMKNTKWFGHYHLDRAEVHTWLVFRVSFSHLRTTVMDSLLTDPRNFNKGLLSLQFPLPSLPLWISFCSFVLFMELIHLPAVLCQGRNLWAMSLQRLGLIFLLFKKIQHT